MELLADIVQNCSLEDSQIEKERDVILRELQENDGSLRDVVFDYLHATAFQGTPLGQPVEGPSDNVRWGFGGLSPPARARGPEALAVCRAGLCCCPGRSAGLGRDRSRGVSGGRRVWDPPGGCSPPGGL